MIFAAIADWAEAKQYPVEFMCTQLGVSVSGYYAWRARPLSAHDRSDQALLGLIGMLYDRLKGNPGVRRMHAELVSLGHRVSRKRVWRLMKAAGIGRGRHPRAWKKTTIRGERPVPAPDLIGRDFTAARRDQRVVRRFQMPTRHLMSYADLGICRWCLSRRRPASGDGVREVGIVA